MDNKTESKVSSIIAKAPENSGAHLSDIICITNRSLCPQGPETSGLHPDFEALLLRLACIAPKKPKAVILREKDLNDEDYQQLLFRCKKILEPMNICLIAHTFIQAAKNTGISRIHLPLPVLLNMGHRPEGFQWVGTNVHSVDDAKKALACGADYLIAGHIFETDCKAGLPGRGLNFLKKVVNMSPVPVYAIGGITLSNLKDVKRAGAAGGCMMSGLMRPGGPDFRH